MTLRVVAGALLALLMGCRNPVQPSDAQPAAPGKNGDTTEKPGSTPGDKNG